MMSLEDDCIGPIDLGNSTEFTMLDLARQVFELIGSKSQLEFLPLPQEGPRRRRPDITKASQELGWIPGVQIRLGLETKRFFADIIGLVRRLHNDLLLIMTNAQTATEHVQDSLSLCSPRLSNETNRNHPGHQATANVSVANLGETLRSTQLYQDRQLHLFIKGGLGNQLFQLAAALKIHQDFDLRVLLRTTYLPERQDSFRGVSRWPLAFSWLPETIQVINARHQPLNSTSLSSKFVTSLFAARRVLNVAQLKYQFVFDSDILSKDFSDNRTEKYFLSGIFGFGNLVLNQRHQMGEIIARSTNKGALPTVLKGDVAIHMRLGDKSPSRAEDYERLVQYFKRAISLIGPDNSARIRIFSDNPLLARNLLISSSFNNFVDAPGELDAISTLALLKSHTHIIGSLSSFSWWASFLQPEGFTFLPSESQHKLKMRGLNLAHHNYL